MTARRRAAVSLLAVVLAVLGAVVLAVLGAAARTGTAAAAGNPYAAQRVVVVGIPGLTWDDVGPAGTPQLAALARDGAVGAVSVRAARVSTCVLDGWATLGAGNRARFPGVPACADQERIARTGPAEPRAAVAAIGADSATLRYGSTPGALGLAVGCAAVVGRAAGVAVAAPGVRLVPAAALPAGPALAGLLLACPLTVVSLDQLTAGTGRAELAAVDDAVGRLRTAVAALPGRTLLLIAGVSAAGSGSAQLHVGIAAGPGFPAGTWLASASTARAPYLQLIDLAPTALRALGRAAPASMSGEPVRAAGRRPPLGTTIGELQVAGTAAAVHYRSTATNFWILVGVDAALLAAGLLALGGLAPLARRRAGPGCAALRALCLPAAAVPVAGYLAGLVPWARAADPGWALAGSVAAAAVGVAVVAASGPWRRAPLGPPLAVLAITFGTLGADVVTGSHLQLNAPLGYDAIVAGRFVGLGNLSFALLATTGLLLTAALAPAAGRRAGPRRARRVTAAATLLLGAVVVGLDAAPGLGSDLGGALAAVPAFLVLAMLLTGTRVSGARVAASGGAAVLVAGAVAVPDWLRPADQRTHLGRFVQQLLDGRAWTVVSRKGEASLGILTGSALTWLLPVALLAAVWLVRPGGRLRSGALPGVSAEHRAALRAGLLAVAAALGIGAAVNDSGVAVPSAAAALLVPLLIRLAAAGGTVEDAARAGPGRPCRAAGEGPDRVTVGSRGSTAWNA